MIEKILKAVTVKKAYYIQRSKDKYILRKPEDTILLSAEREKQSVNLEFFAKLSFKNEGEIKTFSDLPKLREFGASISAHHETVEEALQAQEKYQMEI